MLYWVNEIKVVSGRPAIITGCGKTIFPEKRLTVKHANGFTGCELSLAMANDDFQRGRPIFDSFRQRILCHTEKAYDGLLKMAAVCAQEMGLIGKGKEQKLPAEAHALAWDILGLAEEIKKETKSVVKKAPWQKKFRLPCYSTGPKGKIPVHASV